MFQAHLAPAKARPSAFPPRPSPAPPDRAPTWLAPGHGTGEHGETMGKPWENHGKTMGKPWGNGGL